MISSMDRSSPQSRSQSVDCAHGRTSSTSGCSLISPPPLTPEPSYVAAAAAAHLVYTELADSGRSLPEDDNVIVAPAALILINAFLDQLLFNVLAHARSTSLISLRPAISEILKPRLAKEAIDGADEELHGYMAGGDDEELLDFHNGHEMRAGSDLQRVFRRTRLRCMVYTRLGDLEEEDEESHLDDESFEVEEGSHRLSRDLGSISPAAAIFLTSIIEFLAEQVLLVAGENAYYRYTSKGAQGLSLEEGDVERIAFNKVLGRLWRSWRKRPTSRKPSRPTSRSTSRATSVSEALDPEPMPLPFQPKEQDLDNFDAPKVLSFRHRSMNDMLWNAQSSWPRQPLVERPAYLRKRSSSLPAYSTPYTSPLHEAFVTPSEHVQGHDDKAPQSESPIDSGPTKSVSPLNDTHTLEEQEEVQNVASTMMYDGLLNRHSALPRPLAVKKTAADAHGDPSESIYENDISESLHGAEAQQAHAPTHDDDGNHTDGEKSRASTMSSKMSFQVGVQSPTGSTTDLPGASNLQSPQHTEVVQQTPISPIPDSLAQNQHDHSGPHFDEYSLYQAPENTQHNLHREIPPKIVSRDFAGTTEPQTQYNSVPVRSSSRAQPPKHHPISKDSPSSAFDTNDANARVASIPQDAAQADHSLSKRPRNLPSSSEPYTKLSTEHNGDSSARPQPPQPDIDLDKPTSNAQAAERAGVQRLQDAEMVHQRPPTAGSSPGNSRFRGKINLGRESGESNRLHSQRSHDSTSENGRSLDGGSSLSGQGGLGARKGSKEQDFEQLIKSDETIQYTLTPQNMRDMEDSPDRLLSSPRSLRSLRGLNGLRSNPTQESTNFASPSESSPKSVTSAKNLPLPPSNPAPGRPKVQPREAKNSELSTRDFADFIRSTGPVARSPYPATFPAKVDDAPVSKRAPKLAPAIAPNSARDRSGKSNSDRSRTGASALMARDPISSPSSTTSDLAEFLRSGGPPPAKPSTRKVPEPSSAASSKITQSSINSQSGLLEGPVRKQRRVKDPYAIDSDEDSDIEPRESFSEFLRASVPVNRPQDLPHKSRERPHPPTNAQRVSSSVSLRDRLTQNIGTAPEHPPPLPSMSKTNHSPTSPRNLNKTSRPEGQENRHRPSVKTDTPQLPPLNSFYPNGASPASAQTSSPSNTSRPPGLPRQRTQLRARDDVLNKGRAGGNMADLADFLRETEPPKHASRIAINQPRTDDSPKASTKTGSLGGLFRKKRS